MDTFFAEKPSLSSKLEELIIPVLVSFFGTLITLFPSNPNNMTLQKRSQIVRDGVKYLGENYEQVAQFGEWFVYRLAESP